MHIVGIFEQCMGTAIHMSVPEKDCFAVLSVEQALEVLNEVLAHVDVETLSDNSKQLLHIPQGE